MNNNSIVDYEPISISSADLTEVEKSCGFVFPDQFRVHYLSYNGGRPEKPFYVGLGREIVFNFFTPIKTDDGFDFISNFELLCSDAGVIPEWLVPFADDDAGNLICFSTKKDGYGSIYYYDHEFEYGDNPNEHVVYLSSSLRSFLDKLAVFVDE